MLLTTHITVWYVENLNHLSHLSHLCHLAHLYDSVGIYGAVWVQVWRHCAQIQLDVVSDLPV